MGFWGYGPYQNDVTLDVRDDFENLFSSGKTIKEITDILIDNYKLLSDDAEEYAFFWFALADTQLDFGNLLPFVKEKAIYHIKVQEDSLNHKTVNEETVKKKEMLGELKQKLNSQQSVAKKPLKKGCMSASGKITMFLHIVWRAIWLKKEDCLDVIF